MRAITLLLAAALCCGSVYAAVPHEISYQGYLTNPGGTPVNTTVSIVFSLYDDPALSGPHQIYTETQSVLVVNGVFSVLIGPQQVAQFLLLAFDVPYWLGVKVGSDAEMAPRQPVAASPYAIRSASTESLAVSATVPAAQIIGPVSSAGSFTGSLAGDVTGAQGATAISSTTVTGKALTGFLSGPGAITATDTVLNAINKLDGNVALKAPLASPTFTGTANAASLTVTNTLLAGSVGIPTASTSVVLPAKLNVVAGSPKSTVATTRGLAVTTNDAANPFALDVKIVGAAALTDRRVILQTTDWNLADGGNILLQPQGGNVAVGTLSSNSKLAVAGIIESTSGGVKFPDGTVQPTAARKAQNVVVVAQSGGDFPTISAALAGITDNTASNRYVIYVGPGTYAEQVTMKQYVDIQGAGELATTITGVGNSSSQTGTVLGASNAEMRFLTVENTGGNLYAIAIFNNAAAPRLSHLAASAFGGGNLSAGVLNNASSSPTMNDVTASATGSTAGTVNAGVYNSDSSPTISNSRISASGGSINWGIRNSGSAPGSYTVLVNHSRIVAATSTIANDNLFTTRIGASQLSGGPVSTLFGTMTCAGVYDGAYAFFASTCP